MKKIWVYICLIFLFLILGTFFLILNTNKKDDNKQNDFNIIELTEEEKHLTKLGYTEEEINILKEKLDNDILLNLDRKDDFLIKIIHKNYFIFNNLERYRNYSVLNSAYSIDEIIMRVNIGLDNSYYTNINVVDNPNDLLVLVNKYHQLPAGYEPENLVVIANSNQKLQKVAADNYNAMYEDAKKDGVILYGASGYRSESTQRSIYNRYVNNDGVEKADTYSARAGHSEHQTGLAIDISNETLGVSDFFKDTIQFSWLNENAYKYGFILRYPIDKVDITGYKYEPWHYRYVGIEVSTIIYNEKITLEEYYVKYINQY